jgi:hypothetical protein
MDLVSAITNLQSAQVSAAVQVRVAKKILDNEQMQGDVAVKLIDAAANGVSRAGDELAAQATGLGGTLDTYA